MHPDNQQIINITFYIVPNLGTMYLSEVSAQAESGSQVNMMMSEFVQEWGYPVLPLDGLVNYPLHLVGLGGWHTCDKYGSSTDGR